MASINNHILTVTEPSIKLDKIEFASFGENEGNDRANTSKGLNLIVMINKYLFNLDSITRMTLDCTGVLPILDLSIVDIKGQFTVDTFPRDGDVINIRLGTLDKTSYKDIRMDFDIVYVDSPKQRADLSGGRYSFIGRIKIPGLYAEDCKSYGNGTSLDHVESIANDLKLGVATNISNTDDEMNLVVPFNSMYDTLADLVRHSYIDEDSFQTFSIDPYYYINYVNLNELLNSEETLEDAIIAYDKEMTDMPSATIDDAINQGKLPLLLSNHIRDSGTNRQITSQSLINMAGASAKKNGYKRVLQYYENDSDEGLVSHTIEPLASKNMKDIEEPMKGRRDEDRYKNEIKYKYVGRKSGDPETSNVHLNYEYAAIANVQNMDEVKKMSLNIELETFNPAIHRYHKIPVAIYTNEQDRMIADKTVKDLKEERGFNGTQKVEDSDLTNSGTYVLDNFLSGYYVVGGIVYTYSAGDVSVKQRINLLRREWPSRVNNINKETVTPMKKVPEEPVAPPVVPDTTSDVANKKYRGKKVSKPPKELVEAMKRYGIVSPLERAHFLSQCAHESGNFKWVEEFASGIAYEGRKDLGNVRPGDGVKFKGRGYIQITGRSNYTKYNTYLNSKPDGKNINVLIDPDILKTPYYAADSACFWWKKINSRVSGLANLGSTSANVLSVSKAVNGGTNGLKDRQEKFITYWNDIELDNTAYA